MQIAEKSCMKEILVLIFFHLHTPFDTVGHVVFLLKLEYYYSEFCLSNEKQYVSTNGYNTSLTPVKFGQSQGSGLSLILFFSLY